MSAQIGCAACKNVLTTSIDELLAPMREKRRYYEAHLNLVKEIILDGSSKANKIGNETVAKVKNAMHLSL